MMLRHICYLNITETFIYILYAPWRMGRIKTTLIKRSTNKLVKLYGSELTTDYAENKKIVEKYVELSSKKLRNVIAGYATRLAKERKG